MAAKKQAAAKKPGQVAATKKAAAPAPAVPSPAASVPSPAAPRKKSVAVQAPAKTDEPESVVDQVRRQYIDILAAFGAGFSLHEAGEACKPPLSAAAVRIALTGDAELKQLYEAMKEHRAHNQVEMAATAGRKLFDTGFMKEAADVLLKVAAKTAPALYGDKSTVALTGADGGPVQTKVTMTADEAYRAMLGGPK